MTGALFSDSPGIVDNTGNIVGSCIGVKMTGGGTVLNTGLFAGYRTKTEAVRLGGSLNNRLIIGQGASFIGALYDATLRETR